MRDKEVLEIIDRQIRHVATVLEESTGSRAIEELTKALAALVEARALVSDESD